MKRALLTIVLLISAHTAQAQLAPEIGYMHPAGGQAGHTVEVKLGGYDWTPDMQIFVHDPRIKLEIIGPSSPVLVPEPPYWFEAKGRGYAWPLPREFPARLTIPADVPPGLIKWQVANANGASPPGFIHVGSAPEIVEEAKRKVPQVLAALPITVNGQIRKIEEVDRYGFTTPQAGPVTIELLAHQLVAPSTMQLHGMLQVRDAAGKVIVDLADTEGRDLVTTFAGTAGGKYTLSLHDLDFGGDFSYVYRLAITRGPRVLAAYPAAGKRGTTQKVDFVGMGLATGAAQVETVSKDVAFPADAAATSFQYKLETPHGVAPPVTLLLSDLAEQVKPAGGAEMPIAVLPTSVTSAVESRFGSETYSVTLKKDEKWRIVAEANRFGSRLDLELSILGPDGKQVATADDLPATTDSLLLFAAPADGAYKIVVSDKSGASGSRQANYRLSLVPQQEDFTFTIPTQLSLPLGAPLKLPIPIVRVSGLKEPVTIAFAGLPTGVTAPPNLIIPADQAALPVDLTVAADAPATASLATVTLTANVAGRTITHDAKILIAVTMKPRIKITPEGLDDVRKVHRGSTFLAPVFIERLEGYQGEVVLEMTAKQQRHRQGLASEEFTVPPSATKVEYPIFVPEWMETTKSSRMILNGRVQVADPKGNKRTLLQKMELRIGILPEGAFMKLAHSPAEYMAVVGSDIVIPLQLSRAAELREDVKLELVAGELPAGLATAEPMTFVAGQTEATFRIRLASDPRLAGEQSFKIRAIALKDGRWPVISETTVPVVVK
ncbi:MAG: PPC domain-containing protein [Pirellulaceae bacterium]